MKEKLYLLLKKVLIFLHFFIALNAIPAGLAFVIKPGGELMQMQKMEFKIPLFTDFLIPGLVLLLVIGVGQLLTAIGFVRKYRNQLLFSLVSALILLVWIVVQIALLGFNSWLQPFIFCIGLTQLLLWVLLKRAISKHLII